jgi:hypothetical protein
MLKLDDGYTVEIDNISKAGWSKLLERFNDANLYQTWEYGMAKWGEKKLVHFVLKKSGEIVAAAQIWYLKFPMIRGGFAHVSMGPMWRLRGEGINYKNIQNMIRALHQEFVLHRGVLLRIYSYEKENDEGQKIRHIFKTENLLQTKERHDVTIILNLTPDLEELRRNLRKSWRRQLNKAEKNNLHISVGTNGEMFNSLCKIYKEMLARKRFNQHVANINLLIETQKKLPDKLKMRIFLCHLNGDIVAGQAVSVLGNTGMDVIAAISNNDISQDLRSTYLFEWQTINWLKENGFEYLDLRGYDSEKYPGPSYYKAGLGGEIIKYIGIFECSDNLLSQIIVQTGKFIRRIKNASSIIRSFVPALYNTNILA